MVDGVHYLELVEPIKQLKREGKLKEVLVLCYKAIKAAERDAGHREPAPLVHGAGRHSVAPVG